jgi:hypothetical protein
MMTHQLKRALLLIHDQPQLLLSIPGHHRHVRKVRASLLHHTVYNVYSTSGKVKGLTLSARASMGQ